MKREARTNQVSRRILHVESLETRRLLAGNVTARVLGGSLVVRGDALDNQVLIRQLAPDRFRVEGLGGTTVGGQAFLDLRSVRNNIDVDLGSGNDALGVGNDVAGLADLAAQCGIALGAPTAVATTPFVSTKLLLVRTGAGNDAVGVIAASHFLDVNSGHGNDCVGVSNSTQRDGALISTEGGLDNVLFQDSSGKELTVLTGADDDAVSVQNSDLRTLVVNTAGGNDFLDLTANKLTGDLIVNSGDGDDSVFVDNHGIRSPQIGGNLVVDTGAGNDSVFLEGIGPGANLTVGQRITVLTGSGDDQVFASDLSARGATIDTGAGNDSVEITNATVSDDFFAQLGAGDDTLTITGSKARVATLFGGIGRDTLVGGGGNVFGRLSRFQFEVLVGTI